MRSTTEYYGAQLRMSTPSSGETFSWRGRMHARPGSHSRMALELGRFLPVGPTADGPASAAEACAWAPTVSEAPRKVSPLAGAASETLRSLNDAFFRVSEPRRKLPSGPRQSRKCPGRFRRSRGQCQKSSGSVRRVFLRCQSGVGSFRAGSNSVRSDSQASAAVFRVSERRRKLFAASESSP